jgi:serine/threonine protein kinase
MRVSLKFYSVTVMGDFIVRRRLASGSAVDAYLASLGSGVALVQVSHLELSADPELYARFLDATRRSTAERRHPALLAPEVVRCHDDGRLTFVTALAQGQTVADVLREGGAVPPARVRRWAVRLCEALEFLHQHDVVHGYLAPQHLFLVGDEREPDVRLLDTALLLFRGSRSVPRGALVPAEYLSPERCAGRRATPRCDVYGFGVLLFELLTGAPPFSGVTPAVTRAMHLHAPVPPLPPDLEPWRGLLARCLAKAPEARFGSFAEVRDAVLALGLEATPAVEIELADATRPPLGPGATLGDYRIEALLGEGGMGRVFSARHVVTARRVAIKVLRPELARVDSAVERFAAEAQAVARLHHPNVIAAEAHAREGEHCYFVMELLEGQTLKAVARDSALSLRRVVRLMRQAASALSAAHRVGVIHRDIKPDNLMLVRDAAGGEQLKVVDFGVARVLLGNRASVGQTRTGQVLGTPLWMAPEQALGDPVDARADVYSLSLILYTLLARRFPFDGANLSAMVMRRLLQEAHPLPSHTSVGEPIPPRLVRAVARGLRRSVDERPASMEELDAELAVVEAQLSLGAPVGADGAWAWRRSGG